MDQSEIFHYSRPSTPSQGRNDRPSSSSSQAGPVRRERPNNAPRAFSPATTGQNGMQSQAQKAISVVEWGNNAPLDEEELGSVAVVTNAFKQRPLPAKFRQTTTITGNPPALSSTGYQLPTNDRMAENGKEEHAPHFQNDLSLSTSTSTLSTSATTSAGPQITTAQQFHDHFSQLASSLLHNQDSLFRAHLSEVSNYREACEVIRSELDQAETLVEKMMESLQWVEERGESLRIAGEDLMQEEALLNLQTQHIASRLEYFTFLEQAQRMLNYPGEELVMSEGFLGMVERLDSCLQYLQGHTDFKDAEIYLIRYQQCMIRSMMLIKMYFVNSIRTLGEEVKKKLNDRMSETAQLALLYTKFTSLAFPLRPLLAELELRASQNPGELSSLLEECHAAWISVRKTLVNPRVDAEVKRMQPWETHHDLVDLTRTGCSYLKQTCTDEFTLFKQFFQTGEDVLYRYLEGLCDYLYDHLRPQILHESSLTTLNEVCTVLQALMIQDIDLDDDELRGTDSDAESTPRMIPRSLRRSSSFDTAAVHQPQRPAPRLHAEHLLKILLHDAQTRLVFRSELVIRNEVGNYLPRPADLDYPNKIVKASVDLSAQRNAIAVSLNDDDDDDEPAYFALPSQETQETWYPALRTTLWVLSSLHTYVEPSVFQEVAHEAIAVCRKSLGNASRLLAKQSDKRPLDGQLFLVRHLLILKEMTANVESAQRNAEQARATGVVQTLSALLASALNMVGAGVIFGLGGRSSSSPGDSKAMLDEDLKRVCEEIITSCAENATAGLRGFLDRCTLYLSADTQKRDLQSQDWATSDQVLELDKAFVANVQIVVKEWIEELILYLQDEPTVRVLVPPLQNSIINSYKNFQDVVKSEYELSTANAMLGTAGLLSLLRQIEFQAFAEKRLIK